MGFEMMDSVKILHFGLNSSIFLLLAYFPGGGQGILIIINCKKKSFRVRNALIYGYMSKYSVSEQFTSFQVLGERIPETSQATLRLLSMLLVTFHNLV